MAERRKHNVQLTFLETVDVHALNNLNHVQAHVDVRTVQIDMALEVCSIQENVRASGTSNNPYVDARELNF